MGRKERREREQKRESYAAQRSSEKRKHTLIAVGVFAIIGAFVAEFLSKASEKMKQEGLS